MKFSAVVSALLLPDSVIGFGFGARTGSTSSNIKIHLHRFRALATTTTTTSTTTTTTTQLHSGVGIFFGTSTGSTEMAAELIASQFDDAPPVVDIDTVQGSLASEFQKYDALIVGTPTWNTGAETERSGTGWDEVYYGEMQNEELASILKDKKVAVFGMGDSISYAENYADATGELHDIFKGMCKQMLGYVSQEGYEHEDSKAILKDGSDLFCGLLLDNVNFEELTPPRIEAWVAQLKEEGILESSNTDTTRTDTPAVAPITTPAVAVAATTLPEDDDDESDNIRAIMAQLERENAALKAQLMASSVVLAGSDGYEPHYNAKTGRTMWTSPDGRSCYYTEQTSTKMSP